MDTSLKFMFQKTLFRCNFFVCLVIAAKIICGNLFSVSYFFLTKWMLVWDLVVYCVFLWICDEKINKYQSEAEGQRWLICEANRPQKQGGKDRPQAETNFSFCRTGKMFPTGWRIFHIKSSEWVRGRDGVGNRSVQGFPLVGNIPK